MPAKSDFAVAKISTMAEVMSNIYDKLNEQPHIQALIQDFYYESLLRQQAREAFRLNNLNLKAIILGHRLLDVSVGCSYEDTGDLGKEILLGYIPEFDGPLSWHEYRCEDGLNNVIVGMLETLIGEGILNIE